MKLTLQTPVTAKGDMPSEALVQIIEALLRQNKQLEDRIKTLEAP
ncbi:hypothetical protein [Haematobacter sp. UBA3484]|nr:hypothetical protein [Haematobacter sp. UBA3484]